MDQALNAQSINIHIQLQPISLQITRVKPALVVPGEKNIFFSRKSSLYF
jgi:hypothetical protein